ncbi:radical SAM protein [Candidatus Sumerlaeota bacterium]|nr:radical SAM protein [Candidatus Sumerlaeota bacterium]
MQTGNEMSRRAIIPVFLPRAGCPEPSCVFCNQSLLTDLDEVRSPNEVSEFISRSLQTLNRKIYQETEIAFYGGSFSALPLTLQESYLKAIAPFLDDGRIVAVRISTRPDFVTDDTLQLLKKYKGETIELGVQSFYDDVLQQSGRGYNAATAIRSVKLVAEYGFKVGIHLMLGLPGDTPEKSLGSAKTAISLRPEFVRLHPTLVLRDTILEEMFRTGDYQPWDEETMFSTLTKMIVLFEEAGINVIRVGLQPSRRLTTEGAVVAGLFHPALRELCDVYLLVEKILHQIDQHASEQKHQHPPRLLVSNHIYKKLMSHNKQGIRWLKNRLNARAVECQIDKDDSLSNEEVLIIEPQSIKLNTRRSS